MARQLRNKHALSTCCHPTLCDLLQGDFTLNGSGLTTLTLEIPQPGEDPSTIRVTPGVFADGSAMVQLVDGEVSHELYIDMQLHMCAACWLCPPWSTGCCSVRTLEPHFDQCAWCPMYRCRDCQPYLVHKHVLPSMLLQSRRSCCRWTCSSCWAACWTSPLAAAAAAAAVPPAWWAWRLTC